MRAVPPGYYRLIGGHGANCCRGGGRDRVLTRLHGSVAERGLPPGVRIASPVCGLAPATLNNTGVPPAQSNSGRRVEGLRCSLRRIGRHRGWRQHQRRRRQRGAIAATAAGVSDLENRRALGGVDASVGAEGHEIGARGGGERGPQTSADSSSGRDCRCRRWRCYERISIRNVPPPVPPASSPRL